MVLDFLSDKPFSLEQLNQPSSEAIAEGQQFLRFHLLPDTTALLPVNQLTEVLTIPIGQVVPIPHMPPFVMGVYNWRGEIMWIADLGHLIGLGPLYQQALNGSSYTVIVVHENDARPSKQLARQTQNRKVLGLVIHRVEDMEWCNPDLIQSPPNSAIAPTLAPFLRGHWLDAQSEISLVLEGNAIIQYFSK